MGVIIFIVLVTLVISLYDFISSRDVNRLANKISSEKNKKYGAYALRNTYNIVLSIILGGVLFLFVVLFVAKRGFGWSTPLPEKIEKTDTFLLAINAPPVEQIETLPPSYKLNGKEGQGAPSEARQAQPEPPKEEYTPEPDKNTEPADASSKPKSSTDEKPVKRSKSEQEVYEFEQKLFEEAGGEKKREEIRKKAEERKRLEEEKKRNAPPVKPSNQNDGGNNGAKGQPMVNFVLDGRTPHNNDRWHIRNPGYTCGQGVAGQVVVKIKVNANGDVTDAKATGNLAGINPCLIQQSEAYARKSRFNPAASPLQEGTITYVFAP